MRHALTVLMLAVVDGAGAFRSRKFLQNEEKCFDPIFFELASKGDGGTSEIRRASSRHLFLKAQKTYIARGFAASIR